MNHKTYEVRVYENGDKFWYLNGQLHREDGPACEYVTGDKQWYINGKRHRDDGPAIECANGSKQWFINGQLHREDGPAVEYADGGKEWFINDRYLTQAEHAKATRKPTCDGREVEIDGKKYRLTEI